MTKISSILDEIPSWKASVLKDYWKYTSKLHNTIEFSRNNHPQNTINKIFLSCVIDSRERKRNLFRNNYLLIGSDGKTTTNYWKLINSNNVLGNFIRNRKRITRTRTLRTSCWQNKILNIHLWSEKIINWNFFQLTSFFTAIRRLFSI